MSDETFAWSYNTMYDWYYKMRHVRPSEELKAIIYTAQKVSKGEVVEPFIKPNITYIGRISQHDIPICERYPHGGYLVMDDNAVVGVNKSLKKWLFVVTPKNRVCGSSEHVFADHFTFCEDISDKRTPVHYHSTKYICISEGRVPIYMFSHSPD